MGLLSFPDSVYQMAVGKSSFDSRRRLNVPFVNPSLGRCRLRIGNLFRERKEYIGAVPYRVQ